MHDKQILMILMINNFDDDDDEDDDDDDDDDNDDDIILLRSALATRLLEQFILHDEVHFACPLKHRQKSGG